MSKKSHNLVLYRVENGVRQPVFSLSPSDKVASAKIVSQIGHEMRVAQQRGVSCPEFRVVSEQRTADEGGQFVVAATFVELHATTLAPVSGEFHSLQELFDAKDAAPVAAESAEDKAKRVQREQSAALSV